MIMFHLFSSIDIMFSFMNSFHNIIAEKTIKCLDTEVKTTRDKGETILYSSGFYGSQEIALAPEP